MDMMSDPAARDALDSAYERLHRSGPEFDADLSNHGPMAVEALIRRGRPETIDRWLDAYTRRLDDLPRPYERIRPDSWRDALGDVRRMGDWPLYFAEDLRERSWEETLAVWWPRLLPGIAAGATHGVIRVGHAVRALRTDGPSPQHLHELGLALGYWAARWQPVPNAAAATGDSGADVALAGIPSVPDQSGRISNRLQQLPQLPDWPTAQSALRPPATPDQVPEFLRRLIIATLQRYTAQAHQDPVMLVHGSTAPNAVLRSLPSLPREQWIASAQAAWSAAAAVHAAYAAPGPAAAPTSPDDGSDQALERAIAHGDEHVIKLADTAIDARDWTDDATLLAPVGRAVALIPPA